ncbi:hypothetical protein Tco_1210001 [Tanacetum coccineum]
MSRDYQTRPNNLAMYHGLPRPKSHNPSFSLIVSSGGGLDLFDPEWLGVTSSGGELDLFRLVLFGFGSFGGFFFARPEVSSLLRPEFVFQLVRSLYSSSSEDAELKTLIATYDIPLSLRHRLPDSNFRMSILLARDTAIDKVPTSFNQDHVDRLKAHIVPPLELGTSILGRVVDRTTPPAPAGTAIPHASPEEIADVTIDRPDHNVVAKADHAAKECLEQARGLAAGDGVEQTDGGTLDDDDQCDGSESAMEDVENLNDVGQGDHINVIPRRTFDLSLGLDVTYLPILLPDKEVGAHAETVYSKGGCGAPSTQLLDTDVGADEIASDGNVDSYLDARVSNTARDVLERDLFSFVPGPYYLLYPYNENDGWSVDYSFGRAYFLMLVFDHSLRDSWAYSRKSVLQQTIDLIKNNVLEALREHKVAPPTSFVISDEVSGLKAELGGLKSKCEATEHKISSWDKKHIKYRSERDIFFAKEEKAKIEEELNVTVRAT